MVTPNGPSEEPRTRRQTGWLPAGLTPNQLADGKALLHEYAAEAGAANPALCRWPREYLRATGRPEIYVAGDLAAVVDRHTGRLLPPLAHIALDEAECVARNLEAELAGKPLEPFRFHGKGVVVSVGPHRGVADLPQVVVGGRLAHTLKDLIEWEYRQSVQHLHGWSPI